jgi:hypothetical protein
MIAAIALLAALNAVPDTLAPRTPHHPIQRPPPARADRWFATDKVKHFFMSALIQSSAYSIARRTLRSPPASHQ